MQMVREGIQILSRIKHVVSAPLTNYGLAVLMMLNAAAAAFYYLRVAVYMFMRDPDGDLVRLPHGRLMWSGLAVSLVLTLALGAFPGLLLGFVETAAAAVIN